MFSSSNEKCAKDLRAFAPAAIPSHPDTLSTGRSTRKTSQDFGLEGRARRNGFLPGIQKPVSARLIRFFLTG
jgi:hypothetical protein